MAQYATTLEEVLALRSENAALRAALGEASIDLTVLIEAAKSVGNVKLAESVSGFRDKIDAALNQQLNQGD